MQPKAFSDKELIKRCLQGDEISQKILFDHFSPLMLRLCRQFGFGADDSKDILQEAFISIFLSLHKFKFEGSFEGWIRTIFINTCILHYRKQKKKTEALKQLPRTAAKGSNTNDYLEKKSLDKLIHSLPNGYRTVFKLYFFSGYNHKEIAEMLGISESTSKSQLFHAKKFLKKRMDDK